MFNFAIVQRKATDREEGRISSPPHSAALLHIRRRSGQKFAPLSRLAVFPSFGNPLQRETIRTGHRLAQGRRAPLGEREERELRLHNQLTSGEVAHGTCGDKQKSC